MRQIACMIAGLAGATCLTPAAGAAPLDLDAGPPRLTAESALVDYFEFGGTGNLASFPFVDAAEGVGPAGVADISLSVSFDPEAPAATATGFLDVFDAGGRFLSGALSDSGASGDTLEFAFDGLFGSAAASFGDTVLATVDFDSALGDAPFAALGSGQSYSATVAVSATEGGSGGGPAAVPAPGALPLLLGALGLGGAVARRRRGSG